VNLKTLKGLLVMTVAYFLLIPLCSLV